MSVLLLLAVLALTVGFGKLLAVCVNWLCAHKLPKKIVFTDKCANTVMVIAYPILLTYGLVSETNYFSQEFHPGPAWWLPVAAGVIGLGFFLKSTITYWTYSPPACEVSVESETTDFRVTLGKDGVKSLVNPRGRMHGLTQLKFNEQLTVNVSTKTYVLPGLPPEWDGLSIVHLSDFHFLGGITQAYFELVCDKAASLAPDMFAFTGDLLDDPKLVDWLPTTLGRLKAPLGQYFVLGNHDWYLDPPAIRNAFQQHGWTDLANRFMTVPVPQSRTGVALTLCGDETPWMGKHPDMTGAPENSFRILLSHTPDNIDWARRNGVELMMAGHTHGGQIRLPIVGPLYSPSRYDCRFSAGVFWLDPTLMYVSRGVSGKEPIRYQCPPEVTKLVLRRSVTA